MKKIFQIINTVSECTFFAHVTLIKRAAGILLTSVLTVTFSVSGYADDYITGSEENPFSGQLSEGNMIKPGSFLRDITLETGTKAKLSSIYKAADTVKTIEYIEGIDDEASYENIYGEIPLSYGEISLCKSVENAVSYRWMLEDTENSFNDLGVNEAEINLTGINRSYHDKTLRCVISLDVPESDSYGNEEDYEDIIMLDQTIEVFWLPEIVKTNITVDGTEIM